MCIENSLLQSTGASSSSDMPGTPDASDGDWLSAVLLGTLSQGVNQPTFVVLNIALFLAVLSLLALLAISATANPALVPHVAVLIILACVLWGLIIWFIGTVGLTHEQQQEEEQQEEVQEGQQQGQAQAAVTPLKQRPNRQAKKQA